MTTRMLIDARHSEETRVTVVKGNRVDEFDYESAARRQLKGNIYLARITRVEPSLQAAFVEYGGNRHGFLAFSEIHPDYYQIPVKDREAMLAAETEAVELMGADALEDDDEDDLDEEPNRRRAPRRKRGDTRRPTRRAGRARSRSGDRDNADDQARHDSDQDDSKQSADPGDSEQPRLDSDRAPKDDKADSKAGDKGGDEAGAKADQSSQNESDQAKDDDKTLFEDSGLKDEDGDTPSEPAETEDAADVAEDVDSDDDHDAEVTSDADKDEQAEADDADADAEADAESSDKNDEDVAPKKRSRNRRQPTKDEIAAAARKRMLRSMKRKYSIQEVIKKRQILLVQVVKEERGNKGAALTTYLSLAGRYCVLMPNSTHSGGISRKISSAADRKRLKSMISDLQVPTDMGLIVRTAGVARTKAEIKRDYDYLLRLWNDIRELTMKSVAPCLIYEEADLIRRAIRDMYTREIDEILVEGEAGYRTAKDSMKLLMPSHAKKVQHYKNRIPLYHRYQVEQQLESMYQPVVTLPSGGYVVINPTEALISIDVNSGKSTKEHNIEETALKTNLEATDEIARQLRLRDMAGLVVIDFIDMEEHRNNRAVERRMKEALKQDRARVQVEKISGFGLMEMSRQRLRPNLLEASTVECPHCHGVGTIRSVEAAALVALRKLEEEAIRSRSHILELTASADVAGYLLNQKRRELSKLEERYIVRINIIAELGLGPTDFNLTRTQAPLEDTFAGVITQEGSAAESDADEALETRSDDDTDDAAVDSDDTRNDDDTSRRRRRRRGGRGRGGRDDDDQRTAESGSNDEDDDSEDETDDERKTRSDDDQPRESRGRRRGRRGGRRRRRGRDGDDDQQSPSDSNDVSPETADDGGSPSLDTADTENSATAQSAPVAKDGNADANSDEKPRRRRRRKAEPADAADAGSAAPDADTATESRPADADSAAEEKPAKAKRSRRKKADAADKPKKGDVETPSADTDAASEPSALAPEAVAAEGNAEQKAGVDTEAEAEKAAEPAEPQVRAPQAKIVPPKPQGTGGKKGWWQRALGRD